MEELLKKKAAELELKGLTLQPHVVAIEDNVIEIGSNSCYYVVMSPKHYYSVSSALVAIDLCFKACFVFDTNYPVPCRSSWLFLQHVVYQFERNMTSEVKQCWN